MRQSKATLQGLLAVAAFCVSTQAADAKAARCSTTDNGSFPCQFRSTGRDGSFEISAPGKPTYVLNMVEPGVASGFINLGRKNIPLPGRYLRSESDPACWINDSTGTGICAR